MEEQKHEFPQHHRIDRDTAVVTVGVRDRRAREREVDHRLHSSQRVVGPHARVKIHPVVEELPLSFA
jgi:hypothetical protein